MIYTKEDVKREMIRYFTEDIEGDNRDIIEGVSKKIDTICSQSDVLRACHLIRDSFINITDNGKLVYEDKKYLPNWIKYLVYVIIFDYLNSHRKYKVDELISEMGLKKDFKKKCSLEENYTIEQVIEKITTFFTMQKVENKSSVIGQMSMLVKKAYAISDIIEACRFIKTSIFESTEGIQGKYKEETPKWICMLVNMVINKHIKEVKNYYSQPTLLDEMSLYDDIFGKKNWRMYSPNMKILQSKYKSIDLPFNHSEIESNDIFRAMIHHMVCYSTVLSDTFVDVFGKLGVIPATCANGYKSRQVWLDENDYKILCVFVLALEKKSTVCKILRELQYEIMHAVDKVETKNEKGETVIDIYFNVKDNVSKLIGLAVGLELNIRDMTKEEVHNNIVNNGSWGFDIYKFAACFIIQQYFASEYWMDSRLSKVYTGKIKNVDSENDGENVGLDFIMKEHPLKILDEKSQNDITDMKECLSAELVSRITTQRVNSFVKEDFSEIIDCLYDSYTAKGFSIENIDAITAINKMDDLFCFTELDDTFDLLYVDVPKFIREQERFGFSTEEYGILFDVLTNYKGDWILTWKNFVEIFNGLAEEDNCHYLSRTGRKIIPVREYELSYYKDEEQNEEDDKVDGDCINEHMGRALLSMYEKLKEKNEFRPMYVFSYRSDDKNYPNSIVFITTIDFAVVSDTDFQSKYNVSFWNSDKTQMIGRLTKLKYDDFYTNVTKYLRKNKKKNMDSEK